MPKTAERIQTIRTALGLSQEALGVKMGRSRKTIMRWESGQTEPRASEIERLEALLSKKSKRDA